MKRLPIIFALLVASLTSARPAHAHIEQGRLLGTVKDAQGGVLPGVTVTATSPALMGVRTVTTEADGRYLLASLPSGVYMLTFALQGFDTIKREGVRVTQGSTLTIDGLLQIASLHENVTVSGASPVVDTTTTKVGTVFSGEVLTSVPSGNDIWATLGQTQGVRMQGFDVGGSHKDQNTGYESFGIRNQNKVLAEGIDLTEGDSSGFQYNSNYAIDEVSVTASGSDVEMSSPGTAVVQNFKSGGNTFTGLEHITYEGGSFVGNNNNAALTARGFTGNPNLLFYETHLDLGGPIMRDRLWFYVAYNRFKIDKQISGVDPNVATDTTRLQDPMVKLTYKIDKADTLNAFIQPHNNKVKPNRNLSISNPPETVLAQDSRVWIYKGAWQRVWTNRLYMEVRAAACCEVWPMVPKVDPAVRPPRSDTGTLLTSGAGWDAYTLLYQKPQASGSFTYFRPSKIGSHDTKFGFEFINNRQQQGINGQSGPIRYLDRFGVPDQILLEDVGTAGSFGNTWTSSYNANRMFSLYAQDRWAPTNRLTITAGVRFGYQRPSFEPGTRDPVLSGLFPQQTVPAQTLFSRSNYAPRVGVSYDLSGDGKTAVKAFYGRYYAIYANSLSGANAGGVNSKTFNFLDCRLAGVPASCTAAGATPGNGIYDGPQELGALVSSSGAGTKVDPNLLQPYADEISGSIEHQFWGESSVRVLYVHKSTSNVFGLVNTARIGTETVPVTVPNPFDSTQVINALDIPTSLRGVVTNMFTNIPDSGATYDTLSLSAQKRFGKGIFLQGGFDYQWRNELRQPNSISTSPLSTDSIGVYSFGGTFPINYSADVTNRQTDTNWQMHALGHYPLPTDFSLGLNFRIQSGFPWSPVASVKLPNAGTQTVLVDNIQNRRSDTVPILDLRLDRRFKVGRLGFLAMVDVYNILNANAVTNFFLSSGSTYNTVIAALNPRTVQLGFRVTF
jgi:hypothetical protein